MRVWVCTDHDTHWPVGGAAVVMADDEQSARQLLSAALIEKGLKPDTFTLLEIDTQTPFARILCDGNY